MFADYVADRCLKVNLSANSNCIFMFMFTSTNHCCPYTPLFLLVFKRGQGRLYKLVKNYINTIKCMKIRWMKFFTSLTESWALEHVKFNQITSFSHEKKRASTYRFQSLLYKFSSSKTKIYFLVLGPITVLRHIKKLSSDLACDKP